MGSDVSLSQGLIAAGLSPVEAEAKARMFAENERALRAWRGAGDGERLRWFVPGRIEVLGKHTDYAGGRSLLCAVERGFCVTAVPRGSAWMANETRIRRGGAVRS